MARLFYVHWNKDEALATVRALRAAGHVVHYHWDTETGPRTWKDLEANPPDAIVVSLERLPSHGRRVAMVVRERKKMRGVPVVFVDGAQERVAKRRAEFPEASFVSSSSLVRALERLGGADRS